MVVFTCNHCGETLQKPKVSKHYEFKCRAAPFLTCVDCFKDFRGEEYVAHTKCISEAERYGGKDYVPKAGANKGEKKQQEWINVVANVLSNSTDLSNAEKNFLNMLSKHENIPRKKPKFLNFVKCAIGNRISQPVIDSVWDRLQSAHKESSQTNTENGQHQNGKEDKDDKSKHQENNIIENQNNENICRENQHEEQNKNIDSSDVSKKKSKKRKAEAEEQTVEPKSKKKTKTAVSEEQVNEAAPKKKNESIVASESINNECDVEATDNKSSFDWKATILDILQNKGEISLKKLQKKVITQYMNYCSNEVSHEKASTRFNKKLKKVPGITISDDKVTLS